MAAIDVTLDQNENIAPARDSDQEDTPLIDADTGIVITDSTEKAASSDYDEEEDDDVEDLTIDQMKEFLMACEDTFTDPLDPNDEKVQVFLDQFEIGAKTEEISKLLEENPETLEATFSQLTTDVKYEDFWKRYFFRCGSTASEDDIAELYKTYARREKARAAESREGTSAITPVRSGLASVTNFLGGAVKALVDDGGGDDPVAPSPYHFATGSDQLRSPEEPSSTAAVAALNFFGGGGRPPFVLNTAVSEDDEGNDSKDEDEEEEEELGWDDDDDDFDDDDVESGNAGQIEFRDAAKEKLQEQFDQAVAERDQLQKTVQMQTEELKALKEAAMDATGNKQMEVLKMQIFEKDAELAALKASLDDTHDEDDRNAREKKEAAMAASQTREMERLAGDLAGKDSEISRLKKELETVQSQLESARAGNLSATEEQASEQERLRSEIEKVTTDSQSYKSSLDKSISENSALQAELQALRQKFAKLESNNSSLQMKIESSGGECAREVATAQEATAKANSRAESLQTELVGLKKSLEASNVRAAQLDEELLTTKQALTKAEEELDRVKTSSSPSPGSISTGTQVLQEPTATKLDVDDGDDGWGDDW